MITIAIATIVVGGLVPRGAEANNGNGCSLTWQSANGQRKACYFRINGTPITITGTAAGTTGAMLRIWASPGSNPEIALAECAATGERTGSTFGAQCNDTFTLLVADPVLPDFSGGQAITATCYVEAAGNRPGTAFCGTPENCRDLVADLQEEQDCLGLHVP